MFEIIGKSVLKVFRKSKYRKLKAKRRLRDRESFNKRMKQIEFEQREMRRKAHAQSQMEMANFKLEKQKELEKRKVKEFLKKKNALPRQLLMEAECYRGKKISKDAKIAWNGSMYDLNELLRGGRND